MRHTIKDFNYGEPKADKLRLLEDIEERHGIEILTVYKAMTGGCCYFYNGRIEHFVPDGSNFICPNLDTETVDFMYASHYEDSCRVVASFPFEEYGVTWALTQKELEKTQKRK